MSKIIFSVSYEIIPEKRKEYLALMKQVQKRINRATNQNYAVYEDADRPNLMTEVFYLDNEKDVEEVKRLQQKKPDSLFEKIDQYILNLEQVACRTFNEII